MDKEEFITNTASQLWDEMQSNSGIRDELNALELYSMENFMDKIVNYDLRLNENPFLLDFLTRKGESFASIKSKYMPPEHLSIQVSFNGRNILGFEILPKAGTADGVYQASATSLGYLFRSDCQSSLYVAAADPSHPQNDYCKNYLRGLCSLSSWSQIYARFSLAAAFVGPELVDKALIAADCLNLEEMKEMAEADEFNEQDSV